MQKKLNLKEIFVLTVTVFIFVCFGWVLGYKRIITLPIPRVSSESEKLLQIANLVDSNFYPKPKNMQEFTDLLSSSMLSGLNDANTYYSNADKYRRIQELTHKSNIGFSKYNDATYILKFDWFTQDLEKEMEFLTKDVENSPDKTLIIDIRDNLGGNLESGLWFVNLFLDERNVVVEKYIGGQVTHVTTNNTPLSRIKMYVVVSKETSSAAEMVTAVLKENGRAKIVGESTYGKNSIGDFFELPDKSAVHITTGEWITAGELNNHGMGVKPDIVVENIRDKSQEELVNIISSEKP